MKIKLEAPCHLVTEDRIWDHAEHRWTKRPCKPRLIQNPPQRLNEEESKFVREYMGLLAERIRLDAEHRRYYELMSMTDPDDFIVGHYKVLCDEGYAEIEDTQDMRQIVKWLWRAAEETRAGDMTWPEFEWEVQKWFLLASDKCAARRFSKRTVQQ